MRKYCLILFIALCEISNLSYAQTPKVYANDWLKAKFGNKFLKINVNSEGVYNVPVSILPDDFKTADFSMLELWHNGKQVDIIRASKDGILFYAVPNYGESENVLYRSGAFASDPNSRTNPYSNRYSDISSYFLTVSSVKGSRVQEVAIPNDESLLAEKLHIQTDVLAFSEHYSHSASMNYVTPVLVQSYFESGKGMTSKIYGRHSTVAPNSDLNGDPVFSFSLKDGVFDSAIKPTLEILLYGRTTSSNNVSVMVGKSASSLRDMQSNLTMSGTTAAKKSYSLKYESDTTLSDIGGGGKYLVKLVSKNITDNYTTTGLYSVTYLKVSYPQDFNMLGVQNKVFTLPAANGMMSKVKIKNAPKNVELFDVTDWSKPKKLTTVNVGSEIQCMATRIKGSISKFIASSKVQEVSKDQLEPVTMSSVDPSAFNYLMITSGNLLQSVKAYSDYRTSVKGGAYKPLVIDIKDIYNQFNYGEPSPVAIRNFVDFMISKGVTTQHNLLLVGYTVANGDSINSHKELKGMVPTVGYPGSDALLVSGLGSAALDVPVIPVGRISALKPSQVDNYLAKVKTYEAEAIDGGWKKEVLHLSGGKTASEIVSLSEALSNLTGIVKNGDVGGNVTKRQKDKIIEVQEVDITKEVNNGVGMISYFGHGSAIVTDYDMGYISDPKRLYNNIGKYPLMYFNGCGVGNIFRGNVNDDLTSNDREPLSFDWMYAKDKGAIAIIANSYYSFTSPSSRYIKELYNRIFGENQPKRTIGGVQQDIAKQIYSESYNEYDVANAHQAILQGDPAMTLIKQDQADFSVSSAKGISIFSGSRIKTIEQTDSLQIKVDVSNLGKNIQSKEIVLKYAFHYSDGKIESMSKTYPVVSYKDTLTLRIVKKINLKRIEVNVNPDKLLVESNYSNNTSQLVVDWSIAKDSYLYPLQNIQDLIPPIVSVSFNDRTLKNNSVITANPKIQIAVHDDNFLDLDISGVDIFLKPCVDNGCAFTKLTLGANDVNLERKDDNTVVYTFSPSVLSAGAFEVLVNARDNSNNQLVQPYRIAFQIKDQDLSLTVSPNPSSSYVKFDLSGYKGHDIVSIESVIYNLKGQAINRQLLTDSNGLWYWYPEVSDTGVFLYTVVINQKAGIQKYQGKLIVLAR